ncbi:hypothetical protein [Nocardia pseudobrasiliensis]|uniref:Glucose/sorbosone dehydrogenase n=1 Tax=Nocardia pseudobrasiliensis TaxID=45979 RepID=A0A370I6A4_9NOCA|nr:hypothetical protein [Nocardia pseudobrasiliensis]RDI66256.1 hypothetical protein DFR76_1042 [Nocardia pseudobrasiliensis]
MWTRILRIGLPMLLLGLVLGTPPAQATPGQLPTQISGGAWQSGHVQGIALDEQKGVMYFSFTDLLVKTDLQGRVLGTVEGFTGHLGDLAFNPQDGRVYGSLEYADANAFYIAVIDGDRITERDMDAVSSGLVKSVYLREVVADYTAPGHRYGCSGIDGVAFGPTFGARDGAPKLTVAYGIYSDLDRDDNDYQILLQYDIADWRAYERPLNQNAPHTSGPAAPAGKYFVYTGNTTYGVQNLEYDPHTANWFLAVYPGKKPEFPNYPFFMIEASAQPQRQDLQGQPRPEQGLVLPLAPGGLEDENTGTRGWKFEAPYGLVALGDGRYYVVTKGTSGKKQTGTAHLYRWTGSTPTPFTKV